MTDATPSTTDYLREFAAQRLPENAEWPTPYEWPGATQRLVMRLSREQRAVCAMVAGELSRRGLELAASRAGAPADLIAASGAAAHALTAVANASGIAPAFEKLAEIARTVKMKPFARKAFRSVLHAVACAATVADPTADGLYDTYEAVAMGAAAYAAELWTDANAMDRFHEIWWSECRRRLALG